MSTGPEYAIFRQHKDNHIAGYVVTDLRKTAVAAD